MKSKFNLIKRRGVKITSSKNKVRQCCYQIFLKKQQNDENLFLRTTLVPQCLISLNR